MNLSMLSRRMDIPGPLVIEREVGDQAGRLRDVAHGLAYLRECLANEQRRVDLRRADVPTGGRPESPSRAFMTGAKPRQGRCRQFTTELTTWANWRPASVRA